MASAWDDSPFGLWTLLSKPFESSCPSVALAMLGPVRTFGSVVLRGTPPPFSWQIETRIFTVWGGIAVGDARVKLLAATMESFLDRSALRVDDGTGLGGFSGV